MQINTIRSIAAITGLFLAFAPITTPCAVAEPSDLDLVCSGNGYASTGDPFPNTETVFIKLKNRKLITITLPGTDKPSKANIVSNNKIQLKFSADKLTGEYFKFSGDVFLIHKDGRFTKLICKTKA